MTEGRREGRKDHLFRRCPDLRYGLKALGYTLAENWQMGIADLHGSKSLPKR